MTAKMQISTQNLKFDEFITYPDINISQGITTFISGSSGSGKSTLLRLFNATLSPSEGKIFYKGDDISTLDTITLRRDIMLAGQSVYLFDKDIKGNFEAYYSYRNTPLPADSEIKEYLALTGAGFPLDKSVVPMSGGERQRVYLAICASFKPHVLMLDEPTSALDAVNASLVVQNLKSLYKDNGSLIVVSHDSRLIDGFADTVITLAREGL